MAEDDCTRRAAVFDWISEIFSLGRPVGRLQIWNALSSVNFSMSMDLGV